MLRLKDRQRQIPNGLTYYLPQTKWKASPGSFEDIAQQLFNHLRANPVVAQQIKVVPTLDQARFLVDYYNAAVAQANGWRDYYTDDSGAPPPKSPARSSLKPLAAAAAGALTLNDWFGAGGQPVAHELAESRAAICAACNKNDKNQPGPYTGSWMKYFTAPAAQYIQKMFEKRAQLGLSTSQDAKLEVCMACLCPLQLKVHTPLVHILNRMPQSVREELAPHCWVLKET